MSVALREIPLSPTCSEHALVAAVRRGDDPAFGELYSRYRERIGAHVFGIVGDHARAEDIAQEVFISALRRLRETDRPIAFKPWIYEIAKNASIDEFRRTRRAQEVPLDADEDEGAGRGLLSRAPTPDAAVENKQRLNDLRGAFRCLSENHHQILVMRELEGLSYDQIGERLGMSKSMVESTLFRARRRLSDEYSELVTGRRCERVRSLVAQGGERSLRSLGVRDRRQLTRHFAHCQPCRRHARMAGVDESFFRTPGLIGKIAALLPFPWLRWRRSSHTDEDSAAATSSHQLVALQSLQTVARIADPGNPTFGLGRATGAAAAIAIAAAGGGLVAGVGGHGGSSPHRSPAPSRHTAPAPSRTAIRSVGTFRNGSAGVGAASSSGTLSGSSHRAPSTGATGSTGLNAPGRARPGRATGAGSAGATVATLGGGAASVLQKSAAGAVGAVAGTGKGAVNGLHQTLSGLVSGSSSQGSGLPKLPHVTLPHVTLPSVPVLPSVPSVPSLPSLPSVPSGSGQGSSGSTPALPPLPKLAPPKPPAIAPPSIPLPNPATILPPLGHK